MKAGFNLIAVEYKEDKSSKFIGRIEYRKKNIRSQNRQLKLRKDPNKLVLKPKHTYFDDDGNVVNTPSDVVKLEQIGFAY